MSEGRVVMVQGVGSSVGKSLLTTGLCRVFAQDGYRVAPFKAQNMSLNSAVTPDGLEIGRAQEVQAQAAKVDSRVEMNPILLKPEAQAVSQLVVMGKMSGKLHSREFGNRRQRRERLWPHVTRSLDTLRREYDVVVVEGAGSPAEINLREGDIVNMEVALYAGAPVFIIGDIDKGGVFASLYGTHALISERERRLVKGFIINKFRGYLDLLTPGLGMIEELTGVPVVGVVPYLTDVYVPEEDSPRAARVSDPAAERGIVDVAVIALPHIANFDEFDPLSRRSDVRLRYVREAGDLGNPDLLIIPGSKMTVMDLDFLRESGMETRVRKHISDGRALVGVCGGMQMLGTAIRDPDGIESERPVAEGLGALDIETIFGGDKLTARTAGRVTTDDGILAGASGMDFSGYEIHVGESRSQGGAVKAMESRETGEPLGYMDSTGRVLGTYIHDLFKNEEIADRIIRNAALTTGERESGGEPQAEAFSQEAEFDKLAAHLREHLDMGAIRAAMGL